MIKKKPGQSSLVPGQRWSARRKREIVLRLLRGESLEAVSREIGVEVYRLEAWRDRALNGIDLALKDWQDDPLMGELNAAMKHFGNSRWKWSCCGKRMNCIALSGGGDRRSERLDLPFHRSAVWGEACLCGIGAAAVDLLCPPNIGAGTAAAEARSQDRVVGRNVT